MITIRDLLNTAEYRGNESLLARELNVNRGTLRALIQDTKGKHHEIRVFDGVRQLMTLNTKARRK